MPRKQKNVDPPPYQEDEPTIQCYERDIRTLQNSVRRQECEIQSNLAQIRRINDAMWTMDHQLRMQSQMISDNREVTGISLVLSLLLIFIGVIIAIVKAASYIF